MKISIFFISFLEYFVSFFLHFSLFSLRYHFQSEIFFFSLQFTRKYIFILFFILETRLRFISKIKLLDNAKNAIIRFKKKEIKRKNFLNPFFCA